MSRILKGKAFVYGDNIDTDRIIAGKYTKTLDLRTFAEHVLEDLDPTFRARVRKGDILVAGDNFGCGSSREQAPVALKEAGVGAVLAKYYSRIFFRNAINIGLPVLEVDTGQIQDGDELEVDLLQGRVLDATRSVELQAAKMPQIMIDIFAEDGLVNYLKKHGDYRG